MITNLTQDLILSALSIINDVATRFTDYALSIVYVSLIAVLVGFLIADVYRVQDELQDIKDKFI